MCMKEFNVQKIIFYKGGRALSPFFGPLQKPKYESYSTTISSWCFISWMIKVFWLSIDFNLMVAMVTKMAAKIG